MSPTKRSHLAIAVFLVLGIVCPGPAVAEQRPSGRTTRVKPSGKTTRDQSRRPKREQQPLPIDASPMRMRVETREGVLVVYDAAAPQNDDEECSGYIGYWLSLRDETQYIFPAVLQSEGDLGTMLLALERDLGVNLEALADADDRIDAALSASAEVPSDEIVWEPATLHRAVEIMGFDPEIVTDLNEPGGAQTASPGDCGGCAAGVGPPRNCGSPGDLTIDAFAVAAGCCPDPEPPPGGGGGGGGGSCLCCGALSAGMEGQVSSADGIGTVASCCGPSGACNDGDPCTDNDLCDNQAVYCPPLTCCGIPKNCDDGSPCTIDGCSGGSCWHQPQCDNVCCGGDCCGVGEDCCGGACCVAEACCAGATAGGEVCHTGLFACLETVGGFAVMCFCAPCILLCDPRDEANALVEDWMNRNNETDACRIDAMQHCVGAALLSYDCGSLCAVCAGEVNEFMQGDGDEMDHWNNQRGALDCALGSGGDIIACCMGKLNIGDLRTDGNCE